MLVELIDITHQFELGRVETYIYDIFVAQLNRFVGRCEFRYEQGRDLAYYGNIGYVIYKPYRGHNFAYKACVQLIRIISERDQSLKQIIITCNPDNIASQRTIIKLGAVYNRTVSVDQDHELIALGEDEKQIYVLSV